jgi:nucleolar MIF4G domain-containing protein 1
MSTILSEIESLYRSHPRANVTSTLTDLLLTILSVQQSLLDTFVILHAGFVAALYRLIGVDFAAHLVQTLVERFDHTYKNDEKDCLNIVIFLSELYNFGVVGAGLVYDLIRIFLETMHELDTELLLKIIQSMTPLQYKLMRFGTTATAGRSFCFKGYCNTDAVAYRVSRSC